MKKNGFTLIELMVVVAIIALLVAILVPSLTEAHRVAKMVVCATHLKGIASGVNFYTLSDPRGLVPGWDQVANKVQTDPSMPGYYFRYSWYGGPAGFYQSWMDLIFPYVDMTKGLFVCPALKNPFDMAPSEIEYWKLNSPSDQIQPHPLNTQYGFNLHISGRGNPLIPGATSLQLAQIIRPTQIALVLDYATVYSYCNWWDYSFYSATGYGYGLPWDIFRAHGGVQTNMAYCDLHVETIDRYDPDYSDYWGL